MGCLDKKNPKAIVLARDPSTCSGTNLRMLLGGSTRFPTVALEAVVDTLSRLGFGLGEVVSRPMGEGKPRPYSIRVEYFQPLHWEGMWLVATSIAKVSIDYSLLLSFVK